MFNAPLRDKHQADYTGSNIMSHLLWYGLIRSGSPPTQKYFHPVRDRPTKPNLLSNMRRDKYDDWEMEYNKDGCS